MNSARVPFFLSLALGLGCGGARAPVAAPAVDAGPAEATADSEPPASDIPGPRTVEECEAEAVRAGLTPGCRYEVVEMSYCGGPPPPSPDYGRRRQCICHHCAVDADCGGDRRCVSVPSLSVCDPYPRRMCVGPSDPCFPGTSCPEGTQCGHDGSSPICGGLQPPPP